MQLSAALARPQLTQSDDVVMDLAEEEGRPVVVLGEALAAAAAAERTRLRTAQGLTSPLPALTYDRWQHDYDLLRPVRRPLDDAIASLCDQFAAAATDRAGWRHAISMQEIYTLLTFSQRAVVFALRSRDHGHLERAATAIAMIDHERVDPRDVAAALFMTQYAGAALGQPDTALQTVASLADPIIAGVADKFLARGSRPNLRDECGYDVVETPSGLGLVRRGYERFRPAGDLLSLGLKLRDVVEADVYGAAELELASDLPSVWFRPASEHAVEAALGERRAGMIVRAELRPSEHRSHDNQNLWVFVQEMTAPTHAETLVGLSRMARRAHTQVIGLSAGPVFCLVVAASTAVGVSGYEAPGALARFVAPMQAALDEYATRIVARAG